MNPKILPTAMVVLSLGAAIVYALAKDWKHAIYWTSSAALIASVTY
jgi:hypothetical protein